MKKTLTLIPLLIFSLSASHIASATWIAKSTDTKIDKQQIQSYLEFQHSTLEQVPLSKREKLLENWFIREHLSSLALQHKLDNSEKYKNALQEFKKDLLAKLALSELSKKKLPDFSARAKEIYQAEKDSKYHLPIRLRVKQIFLNEEDEVLAKEIYQKLISKKLDIDEAISKYSKDAEKHLTKGDSYWFHKGQKSSDFYKKASQLSPENPISKPFKDGKKLIILSFVDKKKAGTINFADVKNKIISKLEQEYIDAERKLIIEKIKQDFAENIEINPDFLN